jgi:hypothetical protein
MSLLGYMLSVLVPSCMPDHSDVVMIAWLWAGHHGGHGPRAQFLHKSPCDVAGICYGTPYATSTQTEGAGARVQSAEL